MKKRAFSLSLAIILVLALCCGCADSGSSDGARLLSFSQANSVEEMEAMDGKTVSIIGYMSTLSPVSGAFMYLMNLPYQSCPFCIPNTTQLSNTMAVYAPSGKEFKFTDRAIQVTGTMEFGEYTDEFGYQYSYRIKDATYTVLDISELSDELRLWQQLASTDVIADIYSMFEYMNFLVLWPTYTAQFEGVTDYLYPTDALYFIEQDGAQFNYGFKDGYFDKLIGTIQSVDKEAFAELVDIIRKSQDLCDRSYAELKNGNYTMVEEYTGSLGNDQYKMDLADELEAEMKPLYTAFAAWLASWEL